MKIKNEDDLLNIDYRVQVLNSISSDENKNRKLEAKKRYDIFKDGTKKFVVEILKKELSEETFEEIKHRTSNISILRKIIDKKSMVYKNGAVREALDGEQKEAYQNCLNFYIDDLNLNTKMKKINRYLELFKNCGYFIAPYTEVDYDNNEEVSYKLKSQIILPYMCDVIEDDDNPEVARVYIFSYFSQQQEIVKAAEVGQSGVRGESTASVSASLVEQKNIYSDKEEDNLFFIWWSNKYHFTTNIKGEIINGLQNEDLRNPINKLPIVSFAKDQDGEFWAKGGDDLVDGSILINQLLTDMYFIAKIQGQGIFYLIGPKLPKSLKVGPSDALILERKEGDPDTQVGFATSSPPLESHMKMIEQYVALLLSSNNLEPGTINGELSATSASSGIQEMIRMSENIDDIEDQREIYRDNEPEIFEIIRRWHNLYLDRNLLYKKNAELQTFPEGDFSLKFPAPDRFVSDKEKLEIIEKRRSLMLDTVADGLIRDNPDLNVEQAENKILEILEEKLKLQRLKIIEFSQGKENNKSNNDQQVEEKQQQVEEAEVEAEDEDNNQGE